MTTAQIPARSRRQAMDWSLALVSQGIDTTINFDETSGWHLLVSETERERALNTIHQYQNENRHWPWRRKLSREGALFDWGSVGWAALVCFFYWVQAHAAPFRDAGLMDAAAVSHGQWWRLFTAVFLHADLGHLAMNASLGVILLGLTMGRFGTGVGLLAAFLTGVGGNVTTWLIYSQNHRSLGASGMVMGCVGLLAAQSLSPSGNPNRLKYALGGLVGGLMLFVLLGLSPQSDVLAHLGGFVSGVVLGTALLLIPPLTKSTTVNVFAGLLFCFSVFLPWWVAL